MARLRERFDRLREPEVLAAFSIRSMLCVYVCVRFYLGRHVFSSLMLASSFREREFVVAVVVMIMEPRKR